MYLMDVSRITRGRLELRNELVDLGQVVRAATNTARSLLESVGLTFRVEIPDAPLPIEGDATRLAQVIGNLLSNAGRYTEFGGEVEVRVGRGAGDAQVEVRDTGIGIEADALERIFELFMQADRSPRAHAGLGIGLALAREITELHGGALRAVSAGPGAGSTFLLTLPLASGLASSGDPDAESRAVQVQRGVRVLVADYNVDAAEGLALVPGAAGHVVRTAHDGMAAFEAAAPTARIAQRRGESRSGVQDGSVTPATAWLRAAWVRARCSSRCRLRRGPA
jgi:hypothetical protein